MKKYIRNLNVFLEPYEAVEDKNVVKYRIDNETDCFFDYTKIPWTFGFNTRNDKTIIERFEDIQLAKRSIALHLKGMLFGDRLDKLDYNYDFSSLKEVQELIRKNNLQNYGSVNVFQSNKINLIIQDDCKLMYLTTVDNQKILLIKNSEYILKDFYKAVVNLYLRIHDFNKYKKIFDDNISWKQFYEIYGYLS